MISSADFSARIRDNANIPEDAALFGETADCDNWHPSCRVGFGPRKLPKLFSLPLTQHSQSSRCPIRCQLFLFGSQIQTLNCLHQCKHEATRRAQVLRQREKQGAIQAGPAMSCKTCLGSAWASCMLLFGNR